MAQTLTCNSILIHSADLNMVIFLARKLASCWRESHLAIVDVGVGSDIHEMARRQLFSDYQCWYLIGFWQGFRFCQDNVSVGFQFHGLERR